MVLTDLERVWFQAALKLCRQNWWTSALDGPAQLKERVTSQPPRTFHSSLKSHSRIKEQEHLWKTLPFKTGGEESVFESVSLIDILPSPPLPCLVCYSEPCRRAGLWSGYLREGSRGLVPCLLYCIKPPWSNVFLRNNAIFVNNCKHFKLHSLPCSSASTCPSGLASSWHINVGFSQFVFLVSSGGGWGSSCVYGPAWKAMLLQGKQPPPGSASTSQRKPKMQLGSDLHPPGRLGSTGIWKIRIFQLPWLSPFYWGGWGWRGLGDWWEAACQSVV